MTSKVRGSLKRKDNAKGKPRKRKWSGKVQYFNCTPFLPENSELELLERYPGELRIPHTIVEWMISSIHGSQLSVFIGLLRYSLGFQRSSTGKIKVVFLANWLKMDPSNVSKVLKVLCERGLINRVMDEQGDANWVAYEVPILKQYFSQIRTKTGKSRKKTTQKGKARKSSKNFRVDPTRKSGKNRSSGRVESTHNKESTFNKESIKSLSGENLPEKLSRYLDGIKIAASRKKETESLQTLLQSYPSDLLGDCLEYVEEKGILTFDGLPVLPKQRVAFPFAYLLNHIDRVIRNLEGWKKDKEARERRQIVHQIEASLAGLPTTNPAPSSSYASRIAAFNALFPTDIARKSAIRRFIAERFPEVTNEFEMRRIAIANYPMSELAPINSF